MKPQPAFARVVAPIEAAVVDPDTDDVLRRTTLQPGVVLAVDDVDDGDPSVGLFGQCTTLVDEATGTIYEIDQGSDVFGYPGPDGAGPLEAIYGTEGPR